MKNLVGSLFDKEGTLDRDVYKYHPTSKKELRDIIKEQLKIQGSDVNLNIIDVSEIDDMSWLFSELDPHDIDISKWDVSRVENINHMFDECESLKKIPEWYEKFVR